MAARLVKARPEVVQAYQDAFSPELVGRNCALEHYHKIKGPRFDLASDLVAYASPDSTYAVTKRLIEQARESILIGIYDFTAGYVKELLLKAMRRGVEVSLMLDLDGRTGETELYEDLVRHGCNGVPAPSCASSNAHYFASSHEKVIVIDNIWTLVQSGNYSENSIPQNEKDGGDPNDFVPGNRDMGVAINSKPLAAFFTKLLRSDMKLELDAAGGQAVTAGMAQFDEVEMLQAAPPEPPPKLFASKRFKPKKAIRVTPVLSPDNYMNLIADFLSSATRSIYVEQQYIRGNQENIGTLLSSIRDRMSNHPNLDVRIIVARPFPGKRFEKEAQAIRDLGKEFGLKLGKHVRILNPRYFVHCHNKLILLDDQAVLVSSQNWPDSAVTKNREAGLLLEYAELARYYSPIFQMDWAHGLKTLAKKPAPKFFGAEALGTGKVVPLNWGDYVEV